jgi:tetratricopeptide (TPR) repeat protein
MSRLAKWVLGSALILGSLASRPALAETLDELKVRAKAVREPDGAIEVSRALRRAGHLSEAMQVIQRVAGKARGDEAVAEFRLERARIYIDQREQKRAARECDQLKKTAPQRHAVCTAEAELLNRRGSAALPAAEGALALNPADYDAQVAKGRAQGQLGRPDEAEATLRAAIKASPARPEAYRFLGALLIAQGKAPAGLAALREGRGMAPSDPDILALLGDWLPPAAEARAALERALAARPSFASARARYGEVLLALGELDGAAEALEAALKADARQADWHAALGEVHVAKGAPDLALKSAAAALKIVGNHGGAKLVEARALAAKGDIDLATRAFEEAAGLLRMTPNALVVAARACIKGERLTTAKAFASKATEDFPKSAVAWEVLGDVSVALQEAPEAKMAYDKALAGEGGDKDAIRRKRAGIK